MRYGTHEHIVWGMPRGARNYKRMCGTRQTTRCTPAPVALQSFSNCLAPPLSLTLGVSPHRLRTAVNCVRDPQLQRHAFSCGSTPRPRSGCTLSWSASAALWAVCHDLWCATLSLSSLRGSHFMWGSLEAVQQNAPLSSLRHGLRRVRPKTNRTPCQR